MSSVFPLLNSPYLVISEVFNMLEFHELVNLSLVSNKTNLIIKMKWKKPEKLNVLMISSCFKSSVGYNYGEVSKYLLKIAEKTQESEHLKNLETVEIDGCKMPIIIHEDGYLLLYSNDEAFGLKQITEYVCNLFKSPINKMLIGKSGLWAIDWIKNSQKKPLPNAYIYPNEILSDGEYLKLLTECKVTDNLVIHASAPQSFCFDSNLPKVGCFRVTQGHWVTIDHLLTQDCGEVHVEETKITGSDFNRFVKSWLNFKCPRLEYVYIKTKNKINRFDVLDDLEYTQFDETRKYKLRDGRECAFFVSYVIKRSDGVTASIGGDKEVVSMWIHNKKN